ncbi:carbohydrate sulfotransferase 11-like [Watersipora subatra]|uniref:carbohydrate sulfotransferase 11-like n=1 Tax=Watersipora subatra TaxID=2589382 RepID=UPI00355B0E7B
MTLMLSGYTLMISHIRSVQRDDLNIILDRQPDIRAYLFDLPDLGAATLTISDKQMSLLQSRRKQRIQQYCTTELQQTIREQPQQAWSAIHDHKNRLLFCSIRRCASSAWKQYLLYLNKRIDDSSIKVEHSQVLQDPNLEILYRDGVKRLTDANTAVSFLFVRDPWIRLVSAYLATVRHSDYALKTHAPCSWYRTKQGKSPTFREFVICIITESQKKGVAKLDDYWKPQYLFCSLCYINYKHIGHMETITADFNYIMKMAGRNSTDSTLSNLSTRSAPEVPAMVAKQYYLTLSRKTVIQLQKLYRPDYELHGYRPLPPGW